MREVFEGNDNEGCRLSVTRPEDHQIVPREPKISYRCERVFHKVASAPPAGDRNLCPQSFLINGWEANKATRSENI